MKLQTIDKARYRKHLNVITMTTIVFLLLLSLVSSQLLVALWASPEGENFWLNFMAVASSGVITGVALFKLRQRSYFHEVFYVWRLKQEMNYIYRRSRVLEAAIEAQNPNALSVSYFNLRASKQVYELDNNTLTMDSLDKKIVDLDKVICEQGLTISVDDYHRGLLQNLSQDL